MADTLFEPFPGDQAVHAIEEYLPTGLAFLAVVFQAGKCWLVHRVFTPNISVFRPVSYYATTHQTCSEYPLINVQEGSVLRKIAAFPLHRESRR